eukprot:TRINITY_DN2968_c0_g1_i4.p1 TRINITY_DN2968_c0_g1~~TRINITY_DN2968_c0_g1_i4.p1  ORF type:complete len:308 (+),score=54.06 TRINITY_DN2968_c0_g1_i4:77-925(+)
MATLAAPHHEGQQQAKPQGRSGPYARKAVEEVSPTRPVVAPGGNPVLLGRLFGSSRSRAEGGASSTLAPAKSDAKRTRFATPSPSSRRRIAAMLDAPPALDHFEEPPLMRALRKNSAADVQGILEADPSLAALPFMDHRWEPPICFAARKGCSSDVTSILLLHGAQWSDTDAAGRTAEDLLKADTYLPTRFQGAPQVDPVTGDSLQTPWPSLSEVSLGDPTMLHGTFPVGPFEVAFSPPSWPIPPGLRAGEQLPGAVNPFANPFAVNLSVPLPDLSEIIASL